MESTDRARSRLVEFTERRGEKITARDVATAHLAIQAIEHLHDLAAFNLNKYSDALRSSVHRGVQLDAARAMLAEIKEILE
jgi:fructoselysine-6-P-deglycase FrlB-like protein